jgi:hypothetical protein
MSGNAHALSSLTDDKGVISNVWIGKLPVEMKPEVINKLIMGGNKNMKNNFGLMKRLSILAILVLCLGFLTFTPGTTESAYAAPCCNDCPIPPSEVDPTPQEVCAAQCGASSGSCYNSCLNSVYSCWAHCVNCGGGGGNCGVCYSNLDCLTNNCAGLGGGPNGSGYCTCP